MRLKPYFVCSGLFVSGLLLGCANGNPNITDDFSANPRVKRSLVLADKNVTQAKTKQVAVSQNGFHIVNKGETLYSIAWQYGYDVREVATWNRIRRPYTIYPQQKLRVKPPVVAPKSPKKSNKSEQGKQVVTNKNRVEQPQKGNKHDKKISWQWPTTGNIIGSFSARESGKKGLDIAGKKGQPVYAASGGQVVYSGNGLRGYGNLVIIQHDDTFFSAYAHNHRIYVKEKEEVKKGQHIADMGSSEADRAMLHFEVRRDGIPVDPKRYLPKRR